MSTEYDQTPPKKQKIHITIPDADVPITRHATQEMLDELRRDIDGVDPHEEVEVEIVEGGTISVIPINLSLAINAPIDTEQEMQTLYTLTRNIMLQLIKKSKAGKPHPQLLGYIKEAGNQVEKIHKMTAAVQEEAKLEKLKIVRAMIEANPSLNDQMKIEFIKSMRNKEEAKK